MRVVKRLVLVFCLICVPWIAFAQNDSLPGEASLSGEASSPSASSSGGAEDVMKGFGSQHEGKSDIVTIDDQRKRQVMFFLGVPLLLMLLITGGLGVAMGVYGKQVFVPHMIFAGLSMTLALAHAIVGVVWFYPF